MDMNKIEIQTNQAAWRQCLKRLVALPMFRQYTNPDGRADFIIHDLSRYAVGKIADIGSGRNAPIFRRAFGEAYFAVDMESSYHLPFAKGDAVPNCTVNLEGGHLPFDDISFSTVICTDVLEHLDNIYPMYDELFRISSKFVIISLPNNWPGMFGSFLLGKNISHKAGYGLTPQPKTPGQRHKYFFNFEEASDFLINRMPHTHAIVLYSPRFEYGTDGVLCNIPWISLLFRAVKARNKVVERLGPLRGFVAWISANIIYIPLRIIDIAFSALIWSWGKPMRFYNLFCRQIWVVFERKE